MSPFVRSSAGGSFCWWKGWSPPFRVRRRPPRPAGAASIGGYNDRAVWVCGVSRGGRPGERSGHPGTGGRYVLRWHERCVSRTSSANRPQQHHITDSDRIAAESPMSRTSSCLLTRICQQRQLSCMRCLSRHSRSILGGPTDCKGPKRAYSTHDGRAARRFDEQDRERNLPAGLTVARWPSLG